MQVPRTYVLGAVLYLLTTVCVYFRVTDLYIYTAELYWLDRLSRGSLSVRLYVPRSYTWMCTHWEAGPEKGDNNHAVRVKD